VSDDAKAQTAQETAPAQAQAVDPSETKFVADATADGQQLEATAKSGLAGMVDDAQALANKLLTAAAGDAVPLVTDAEAAAIPFLASHAGPYAAEVRSFGATITALAAAPLNQEVDTYTKLGLQYAQVAVAAFAADVEKYLK
jgi:hypothetical protein